MIGSAEPMRNVDHSLGLCVGAGNRCHRTRSAETGTRIQEAGFRRYSRADSGDRGALSARRKTPAPHADRVGATKGSERVTRAQLPVPAQRAFGVGRARRFGAGRVCGRSYRPADGRRRYVPTRTGEDRLRPGAFKASAARARKADPCLEKGRDPASHGPVALAPLCHAVHGPRHDRSGFRQQGACHSSLSHIDGREQDGVSGRGTGQSICKPWGRRVMIHHDSIVKRCFLTEPPLPRLILAADVTRSGERAGDIRSPWRLSPFGGGGPRVHRESRTAKGRAG